jgi:hypothetical protein
MRKLLASVLLVLVALALASASPAIPPIPRTLANARFVYVAAYDGDQFNPNLLSEDRIAIASVQGAIQKWGKLIVVYRPDDADIILLVQSRPSEDVLALYDAHGSHEVYLWRMMGHGGLQPSELPLVSDFQRAWEKISN